MFFLPSVYRLYVDGILTENGSCTNGNATIGNESRFLNESADDYLKNLSADNRLMAEILCHGMLNETTAKH
jgi:hypothetical protein